MVIKYSCLFFLCLVMAACHPTHTSKQMDVLAQKLDIKDEVRIERWNHHVFSSAAKVVLSLEDSELTRKLAEREGTSTQDFLHQSQSIFNQYFSQVIVTPSSQAESFKQNDKLLRAGFHFRMKLDNQVDGSDMVSLSLTVMDINSREVIDKIVVSVVPASLSIGDKDRWELFEQPLHQLAELLTSK